MTSRPVIVGYDGSEGARQALLWAVRSTRPERDVVVLAAHTHTPIAEAWLRDGAEVGGVVDFRVRRGRPAAALVSEARARDAGLIVVGHRHGRRLAALRGSVALELIDRAPCPVVVVPDAVGEGGCTLVGYDGSAGARDALHWALAHDGAARPLVVAAGGRTALAAALLDELVLEDDALLDADFSTRPIDGHTGPALADAAERENAQAVVIGRGPHAHEIVEHARRPVIVVPLAS